MWDNPFNIFPYLDNWLFYILYITQICVYLNPRPQCYAVYVKWCISAPASAEPTTSVLSWLPRSLKQHTFAPTTQQAAMSASQFTNAPDWNFPPKGSSWVSVSVFLLVPRAPYIRWCGTVITFQGGFDKRLYFLRFFLLLLHPSLSVPQCEREMVKLKCQWMVVALSHTGRLTHLVSMLICFLCTLSPSPFTIPIHTHCTYFRCFCRCKYSAAKSCCRICGSLERH